MKVIWRKQAAFLLGAFILVAVVYTLVQPRNDSIRSGELAPDFMVTDLEGKEIKLSDYRGKGVLLNFWGSWCAPCLSEMPRMNEAYRAGIPGTEILTVNVGETRGTVEQFVHEHNLVFPVLIDPSGRAAESYRVNGLPSTFLIDGDGRIASIMTGEMVSKDQIEQILKSLQPKQ
ncbi:MAG: thiol-disulfide oxidoreductase ResA [Paenibacillaceae bacterium]